VNAPVRVLSDGQNAPSGGSAGGEQTAGDSTGAQAGSVSANAPIRVASDGNDSGGAGSAGDDQTTTGSDGTAQVGSAGVSAPIRLASDGDTAASGGSGSGADQTASGSDGAAQVGAASISAPIRVASAGDDGATAADGDVAVGAEGEPIGDLGGSSSPGTGAQGGPVAVTESIPDTGPADLLSDGSSTSASLRPVSAVLGAAAESLPLTGLGLLGLLLAGLTLLSSGAALRRGSVAAG
jgi:hypothetical protein